MGRRDPFPGPQLKGPWLKGCAGWGGRATPLQRAIRSVHLAKQRTNLGFLGLGEGLPTANLDLAPNISIFKGPIVTRK